MPKFKPGPGKNRPRFSGKVVRVTWDDASYCGLQVPLDEVDEGFVVETFGLCTRESKKGLTLTMDIPRDIGDVRHSSFVPWGMVTQVKVYGTEYVPRKKKKK